MTDWQAIVRDHGPAVWRTAHRLLGNRADAEECFQETFADAVEYTRRKIQPVAAWRARMGTAEARQHYRRRAPVAEGVHAQQSNRGWRRFRLRGLGKVRSEACWQSLAHNVVKLLSWEVDLAGTVRAERV